MQRRAVKALTNVAAQPDYKPIEPSHNSDDRADRILPGCTHESSPGTAIRSQQDLPKQTYSESGHEEELVPLSLTLVNMIFRLFTHFIIRVLWSIELPDCSVGS